MSKYFEKLFEEELNLTAKKLELEGLESEHSVISNRVSDLWQKCDNDRSALKALREDLKYFELGYKKLFYDHFDEAKANWGFYVFVFIVFSIVSGILIANGISSLAILIGLPFVGVLIYDVVNFLENEMGNLKRINRLRKEKTKEEIESEIRKKDMENSEQRTLYDKEQVELNKTAVKQSKLESFIYEESGRLEEFRKKCNAGQSAALKEFFHNMPPEQREAYENSIDSSIEAIIRKLS